MWIVKENLVGTFVRVVQRHDDKILWRCVVRGIGLQGSFRLLVEITEVLEENGVYGVRRLGELVECTVDDEWLRIDPETPPLALPIAGGVG